MTTPPKSDYLKIGYAESLVYDQVYWNMMQERLFREFVIPTESCFASGFSNGGYVPKFNYAEELSALEKSLQKDTTYMKFQVQTWLDGAWKDRTVRNTLSEAMNWGPEKAWAKGPDNLMHGIDEDGYLSRVLVVKGQWQLYRRFANEPTWVKGDDYDSVTQAKNSVHYANTETVWIQKENTFYGINNQGTAFKIARED